MKQLALIALFLLMVGCKYQASDIKCYAGNGEVVLDEKFVYVSGQDGHYNVIKLDANHELVGNVQDNIQASGNCVVTPSKYTAPVVEEKK